MATRVLGITHTTECDDRQELYRAWFVLWPHYCRHCRAEGGFYDPGVRYYADGSGEPPNEEMCMCVAIGVCPRCLQALVNVNPFRTIAYVLTSIATTAHKQMRQELAPTYKNINHPIYGEYPERKIRYARFHDDVYMPMERLANTYYDIANQYDQLCGVPLWIEADDDPPSCVHCGYGHGKHTHDRPPDAECYCLPDERDERDYDRQWAFDGSTEGS